MAEPYDPEARRDTPLALKLKARIKAEGPISHWRYMEACQQDPEFGYYRTRSAIGAAGDFVTAPEISQVFGELIGLCCAIVWEQMGKPKEFNLVEFGPGRGTMLRDALRACRVVPDFRAAVRITLIESNAALEKVQRETLAAAGVPIVWFPSLRHATDKRRTGHIERRPGIVLANEFLDTLLAGVVVFEGGTWVERHIGLDADDRLVYVNLPWVTKTTGKPHTLRHTPAPPSESDVFVSALPPSNVLSACISAIGSNQFAALMIDYGQTTAAYGEHVQAIRSHTFEHPLTSPGEADLSIQVDFEDTQRWFSFAEQDGPITQAEFLGSLGIMERASRLMAANPAKANTIETGVARLMAPNGMGTRFKVLGVRARGLPPLPGFPTNPAR
jgi:NADH dehydrogenase [ubiquinone] 1 alpha subcomplex assembly factor 7